MAILKEIEAINNSIFRVAEQMIASAITAPKAKGVNNIECAIITDKDILELSDFMKEHGLKYNMDFFVRDSENIKSAKAIVVIGTKFKNQGILKCGMCGFDNCESKNKYIDIPCAFNTNDLGIAIGSAVSVASNNNIDNRVMFSIGQAAIYTNIFGEDVRIAYGIPLSVSSKNPFFDRPTHK